MVTVALLMSRMTSCKMLNINIGTYGSRYTVFIARAGLKSSFFDFFTLEAGFSHVRTF